MVVIKNYTSTQISSLSDITGRVLYDSTLNVLRFNDSDTYNNLLVSKDINNNLSGINNLSIGGNSVLSGTLDVTGASTFTGAVTMAGGFVLSNTDDATSSTAGGALTIAGGVGVAKKLFVGTNLSVGGTSTLTGAATLSSTLAVTGASTLSSTLAVTGATTLSSTLDVTGASTLSSTLGVTGATTLSSTLGVTGATTLSSTLGVTGIINFDNITDATSSTAGGCLTIAGGVGIAKKLFVGTDLSVSGTSTLAGAATLSSTLAVTGASTLTGAVTAQNTLGVTGATTLSSTLAVTGASTLTGAATLSSTLAVTGASTLTGAVTTQNTLGVTGATTLSSTLAVTGASTLTGAATLSNTLAVTGAATLSSTLGVTGAATLSSTLDVTGAATLSSTLGVNTTTPTKQAEINSSTGDCLRLSYDAPTGSATNYSDFSVSSDGVLNIAPSSGNINLSTHNASTTGLQLNGTLVTASATQINYNNVTPGIASATKALIVDADRNIVNVNYLEVDSLAIIKSNSANNTIDYPLSLYCIPATTPSVGLGTGIEFNSVNDTDGIYNAAYINYVSSSITTDAETGFLSFQVANGGTIDSVATISNNGVISATSMVETSDVRTKENINETLSIDSLMKILQVNVKTYNYKKDTDKRHCIGVIAQEIKEIIPESVIVSKNEEFDDFHQVQYTALVPHLINCIKVLNNELNELKAKVNKE